MLEDEPDAVLVRCIQAGTGEARAAEAILCRRFGPRARLYGMKHLRDEERARDLAQAVLVAMLVAVRAGRVDDPERIDRFVLGTCRNLASKIRASESRLEPTEDAKLDVARFVPDEELIDTGALVGCLGALESRGRVVLQLTFQEQRSADEIAVELGTSAGNVRVLRHRALAALRRCLDGSTS
jgi:RNA polymerase sigma-70 factor (ECF subfamily)